MIDLQYIRSFPEDVLEAYLMDIQIFHFHPKKSILTEEEMTLDMDIYMCIKSITDGMVDFSVYNSNNKTMAPIEVLRNIYIFLEEWLEFADQQSVMPIRDIALKAKLLLLI